MELRRRHPHERGLVRRHLGDAAPRPPVLLTSTPYTAEFFAEQRDLALRSARRVVPVVLELLRPASVLDLGCGLGTWLSVFVEHGVADVVGVDGAYVDRGQLDLPPGRFVAHDLAAPLRLGRRFDLAMSLEVAEHLPPEAAEPFVDSLAAHAPAILFSAAIPEQDGANHVHTRWPSYWRGLFEARGLRLVDCVRPRIWDDDGVAFWYRQNALLFVAPEVLDDSPVLQSELRERWPLDVVHPLHWQQVTHQARVDREALDRLLRR